ncbi:MAG TPA: recombinase family protein [Ktedonobacteraceae bacterium]|nr:recombinase family protein [Ktedonobacteraceae bacterium]
MPRRKHHRNRVYQVVGEPGPGAVFVGYVRYSSDMQDPASIVTQKRVISEFAKRKGWKIIRWYEEPAHSAKYEEVEKRPVFAELLNDADAKKFQGVLCYANNRWARNVALSSSSIARLRHAKVWWATADGQFDIDRIQEDAGGIMHTIDSQMNEAYVRQLSKRTIDGKEDRAREGYHNGWVPFGYRPPEYPKAPDGAPSTWRPPRMPACPDPVTFPALVKIGELTAKGWADQAIADELEGYISKTSRFGERLLTKDTIAGIRRSDFPCEFAPGCGHGTILTPAGDLVEGMHQAAWPYELWQRMREVKMSQFRRPTKDAQRRPHEFSRIIVCAACRRRLRIVLPNGIPYYKDTSKIRKLDCPLPGPLSVKAANVIYQFGDILRSVELPDNWREAIAERCSHKVEAGEDTEHVKRRRAELEAEQKRLVMAFTKGYMTEEELDTQVERIRSELFTLPIPVEQDAKAITQAAISAGETLADMAGYWSEATPEERRDMVGGLLIIEGLIYDLERQTIVGLLPKPSVLPVLALGLEKTGKWEQRDEGLWLCTEYWPPKRDLSKRHLPPPAHPSLSPAQREEAIRLLQEPGMSIRKVANILGVSRETIHRLTQQEGIVLQTSQKLTLEQREEAFLLLDGGMSLRQAARHFGVSPESLRRLVKRHKL